MLCHIIMSIGISTDSNKSLSFQWPPCNCFSDVSPMLILRLTESLFFLVNRRRSNCVKEIERLKKNREERRYKQMLETRC